jgi:hypothetical protein
VALLEQFVEIRLQLLAKMIDFYGQENALQICGLFKMCNDSAARICDNLQFKKINITSNV